MAPMLERIYIGGLDPSRLSADEVVARLERIPGLSIVSTDIMGAGRSFFYVNAKHRTEEGAESSALDLIAKQYHNVRWKGSRLSVQAARPHFLERLAEERQQRQRQQTPQDNDNVTKESHTQHNIPRHLRIRRRFGQQAHSVDTKPQRVQGWSEWTRAVHKMRAKRERYCRKQILQNIHSHGSSQQPQHDVRVKPFHNRAVHLRFLDDDTDDIIARDAAPSLVVDSLSYATSSPDTMQQETNSSSSADEESSASPGQESSVSSSANTSDVKQGSYVWSDDNDESDSDSMDSNAQVKTGPMNQQLGCSKEHQASSESESDMDEDDEDTRKAQNERSSYEEANSDVAELPNLPQTSGKMEEFSSAIDFDSDHNDDSLGSHENQVKKVEKKMDLQQDVESNLSILSSLFPGMVHKHPRGDGDDNSVTKRQKSQLGWETNAIMQRFDPTKESAKKFIVDAADDGEKVSKDEHIDGDQGERHGSIKVKDGGAKADGTTDEAASDLVQNVYEQGKLEDVFRQARESAEASTIESSSTGAFAFAFDLGDANTGPSGIESRQVLEKHDVVENKSSFAFSSDVGPQSKAPTSTDAPVKEMDEGEIDAESIADDSHSVRRRGFLFPKSVLDQYANAFFAMNEGSRILDDLDGFRNDEELKKKWLKERQTLTLDWKRKKKFAQSRLQTKAKFR